jgi:NTP pyrophosphatase (non-canonical NTP hydrolase)
MPLSEDEELELLHRTFQLFIDEADPLGDRTEVFTVDGAAYCRVTPGQRAVLMSAAPEWIRALNTAAGTTGETMPIANTKAAADYLARLSRHRGEMPPPWYFIMKLTGEASEAQDAWMDWAGWSRHPGTLEHVGEELADAVISAYAAAMISGIDLDAAIAAKYKVLMARDLSAGSDPAPAGGRP